MIMARTSFSGPISSAGGFITGNEGYRTVTSATATVDADNYGGTTVFLDRLAGVTITLPAASGTGNSYSFYVKTAPTSNAHVIKVARSADTMVGWVSIGIAAGGNGWQEYVGGTDDTMSMNGTTTGGLVGSFVTMTDIATNVWLVDGQLGGSGTLATPFTATV